MNGGLSLSSLALLAFCVLTDCARELNFKAATLRADRNRYVVSLLAQPFLWSGLVFWAVEVGAWVLVLERTPLAIAFPLMALTYAGTPLAAGFLLQERLTKSQKTGAALVAIGVLVVSFSGLKA